MGIEVRTKVTFKPWQSPNFATLDNISGGETQQNQNHTIHVSQLDEYALAALADEWLENLYAKTEHTSPFKATPLP